MIEQEVRCADKKSLTQTMGLRRGARILLADNEYPILLDLKNRLDKLGYQVCAEVAGGEDVCALAEGEKPDLALLDMHLTGPMDSFAVATFLEAHLAIPVVFITSQLRPEVVCLHGNTPPFGYLITPFSDAELQLQVELALDLARMVWGRRHRSPGPDPDGQARDPGRLSMPSERAPGGDNGLAPLDLLDKASVRLMQLDCRGGVQYVNPAAGLFLNQWRLNRGVSDATYLLMNEYREPFRRYLKQELVSGDAFDARLARAGTGEGGFVRFTCLVPASYRYDNSAGLFSLSETAPHAGARPEAEGVGREIAALRNQLRQHHATVTVLLENRIPGSRSPIAEPPDWIKPQRDTLAVEGTENDEMFFAPTAEPHGPDFPGGLAVTRSQVFTLSDAEITVAVMVRQGLSSKEIADRLNISTHTVSVHRRNIRRKLGLINTKKRLREHLRHLAWCAPERAG